VSAHEVRVGDRTVRIEPFSGRKGARMLRVLEHVSQAFPQIQRAWADYTSEYEQTHTINLDRAYARTQLSPQPLVREEPLLNDAGEPLFAPNGAPLVRREPMLNDAGEVLLGPDPLAHLTDEDWVASGNKLRQPRSPRTEEQVMAVLPLALDIAETEVAKLLALLAMSNEDVRKFSKNDTLWDRLTELGDELLDAPLDELAELMVAGSEALSEQYQVKIRDRLGERLAAMGRLFGWTKPAPAPAVAAEDGTPSSSDASTTNPTSSTDSLTRTDGERSEPSTERAGVASTGSSSG
jgi:hypothetical protein